MLGRVVERDAERAAGRGGAGGLGACDDQCTYYGCNLFDVLENVWKRQRGGEDVVNVTYKRVKILFFLVFRIIFLFCFLFLFEKRINVIILRKGKFMYSSSHLRF